MTRSAVWSGVRALLVAAAGGGVALFATFSCGSVPDSSRYTVILQPDYDTYKTHVDDYLRRRCGTLDCHGQPGRAYRIYGREGFRLYNEDADLVSGFQPTTEAETRANFQAAVGLEPEEMSRVVASQGADPKKLLLLRKPLQLEYAPGHKERHKGGEAMGPGDRGYECVEAWLRVPVFRLVEGPDGLVPEPIPPGERPKMSDAAINACREAAGYP
jgi:hypothetical protein